MAGRDYTWTNIYGAPQVAIVTENLAREYWGSPAAAIGKRIRESLGGPWREVIGVVGNERDNGVDRPAPTTIYWPILSRDFWGQKVAIRRTVTYAVRSNRAGSQAFLNEIRQAVWSVNSDLPLAGVKTLGEQPAQGQQGAVRFAQSVGLRGAEQARPQPHRADRREVLQRPP